jgi:hypothetical protein
VFISSMWKRSWCMRPVSGFSATHAARWPAVEIDRIVGDGVALAPSTPWAERNMRSRSESRRPRVFGLTTRYPSSSCWSGTPFTIQQRICPNGGFGTRDRDGPVDLVHIAAAEEFGEARGSTPGAWPSSRTPDVSLSRRCTAGVAQW